MSFSLPPSATPFASWAPSACEATRASRSETTSLIRGNATSGCALGPGRTFVLHFVARRTPAQAQLCEFCALPLRQAERLVASRQVRKRPVLRQVLIPGRCLQREVRVGEVRSRERDEIGLP